jgi:DNA-binding NarL/FixJ family response regulator
MILIGFSSLDKIMTKGSDIFEIVLAEKYPLVRIGIHATLSKERHLNLLDTVSSFNDIEYTVRNFCPHVLLLSLNVSTCTSDLTEAISLTQNLDCKTRVLLLSTHEEAFQAHNLDMLVKAGAQGFLLKEEATSLNNVVLAVAKGQKWFSQAVLEKILYHSTPSTMKSSDLTEREQDVVKLLARGMNNAEIAKDLDIAQQSVRNYLSQIYNKLEVRTRTKAVIWARENNFHQM